LGVARGQHCCSPPEFSDRLELRSSRCRDGRILSCSFRVLQSLARDRVIALLVDDTSMTFASLEAGLRGLPAIPRSPQTDKLTTNPLMDFLLLQSFTRVGPSVLARRRNDTLLRTHSPEVSRPYSVQGDGERPTPGLSSPTVQRLQAFSAS
jgi:hypothetical protein